MVFVQLEHSLDWSDKLRQVKVVPAHPEINPMNIYHYDEE